MDRGQHVWKISDYIRRRHDDKWDEWKVANSDEQWRDKNLLVDMILENDPTYDCVWILGVWFGHIIIPRIINQVNKILVFDYDTIPVRIAMSKFPGKDKIIFREEDVNFELMNGKANRYLEHAPDLVINTACEHMYFMHAFKIDCMPLLALQGNAKEKLSVINPIENVEHLTDQAGLSEVVDCHSDGICHSVLGYA